LQFKEPWTNLKATRNKNLSKLSKININKNKKYTNIDKPEKMKKIDINEKMIIMEKKVDIPENKMNEMIEFYNKYHVKREVNNVVKKEVLDFTNFGTLIVFDSVFDLVLRTKCLCLINGLLSYVFKFILIFFCDMISSF
jgi:hypothetical protein